jgi:hypothetical protein
MTSEELDAAVADAVAQCEGDLLAAMRMLVVAVDFWQGLAGKLADAVAVWTGVARDTRTVCEIRQGSPPSPFSIPAARPTLRRNQFTTRCGLQSRRKHNIGLKLAAI